MENLVLFFKCCVSIENFGVYRIFFIMKTFFHHDLCAKKIGPIEIANPATLIILFFCPFRGILTHFEVQQAQMSTSIKTSYTSFEERRS